MTPFFWFESVICVISFAITANTLNNLRAFRRLSSFIVPTGNSPFVSLLVPARDEARTIGVCLDSLLRQEYPAYEVLVLDDGSTDETAAIVRGRCDADGRLQLIVGEVLPEGWLGKAYACHQLSAQARGEVLIFTDADTVHASAMIRAVIGAIAAGADVVTAFPEQEVGSWSERLAVSFMLFTVWAFLPVGRVWSDPSPRFAAANGQLLAFTRAAYVRLGGHAAVRQSILDDVDLARRAKRLGLRVRLADGVGTVRTRMYRGFGETWRGFSKNALALVGGSYGGAVACASLVSLLYVAPIGVLIGGAIGHGTTWEWRILPAFLCLAMLVQSLIVAVRTRMPLWQTVLHPLGALFFILILANSIRWRLRGRGEWKGRAYDARPSVRDEETAPR